MAHHLVVGWLDAAIGPQVRPADGGRGQPDDRVGGLDDLAVLTLLDPDITGGIHHNATHLNAPLISGRSISPASPSALSGRYEGIRDVLDANIAGGVQHRRSHVVSPVGVRGFKARSPFKKAPNPGGVRVPVERGTDRVSQPDGEPS
jgi:hypothetical protein